MISYRFCRKEYLIPSNIQLPLPKVLLIIIQVKELWCAVQNRRKLECYAYSETPSDFYTETI